jgi:hypothetical protein
MQNPHAQLQAHPNNPQLSPLLHQQAQQAGHSTASPSQLQHPSSPASGDVDMQNADATTVCAHG